MNTSTINAAAGTSTLRCLALCIAVLLGACGNSNPTDEQATTETTAVDAEAPESESSASEDATVLTQPPESDASANSAQAPAQSSTSIPVVSDSLPERCPTKESLSETLGISFVESQGLTTLDDFLATDPNAEATTCIYSSADATEVMLTLHGSPIDAGYFLADPFDGMTVTELPGGEIQLQFDGQTSCEVYGDQVSAIVVAESDSLDVCTIAFIATELGN